MSETNDEIPERLNTPAAGGAAAGREATDYLDAAAAATWEFFESPGSPILFPNSPPLSLAQLQFPPPSSPIWVFEDRAVEVSGPLAEYCQRVVNGNPDPQSVAFNGDDSKMKQSQVSLLGGTSDRSSVIKQRMSQALRYFKESTDQHILVQVWAPVKDGSRCVLTTSGQPFVLNLHGTGLFQFRAVSLMYMFSADDGSDAELGLPGRVFRLRLPEWTPNVQYYSSKEYPRLNHALRYDVRGSLALPIFEPSGQSCVGVVEMILTSQKVNYASEVDKVCKALEAVNLKSSEILEHPNRQISNEGRHAALAEILEILSVICEEHKLPLAQTWVTCRRRSVLAHGGGLKRSCSSFDGSCMGQVCVSTTDVSFYVIDARMWGFRDACVEHHLQKGQGVVGKAFESGRPCFSRDVTQFCKSEYPLVHYAKMFGLASCLAVCLQSTLTGYDDYVLEFFLPPECRDITVQQTLVDSISTMMKQRFQTLKVSMDAELDGGTSFETVDMLVIEKNEMKPNNVHSQSWAIHHLLSPETKTFEVDDSHNDRNTIPVLIEEHVLMENNIEKDGDIVIDSNGCENSGPLLGNKTSKLSERKRGKAEKLISVEVLQQYFAGSLKDAAKSLGVCPTTMKRICRQHGISRWPSRRINKVNRSLSKLKHVIDSVQGPEGAINLASITCPLPVAVGSLPWPAGIDGSKLLDNNVRGSSPLKMPQSYERSDHIITRKDLVHDQTGLQPDPGKDSHSSKTRTSLGEGSLDAPTSQGFFQGIPGNENRSGDLSASSKLEQEVNVNEPLGFQPIFPVMCTIPDAIIAEPEPLLCAMLIEDSGSSKDLKNLCRATGDGCQDEHIVLPALNQSPTTAVQDPRTVVIKASYKEDIIRFRLSLAAGFLMLRDEVVKRLKLEVSMFDMKYLDDDQEWVMLACDADLEECMEIARFSGRRVIRLSIQDIVPALGSSCERSG